MDLNSKRLLIKDALENFSDNIAMDIADSIETDINTKKTKRAGFDRIETSGGALYVTGRAKLRKDALLKFLFSRLSDDELIQLKFNSTEFIDSISKFDI